MDGLLSLYPYTLRHTHFVQRQCIHCVDLGLWHGAASRKAGVTHVNDFIERDDSNVCMYV